jgi:(p)ppGpp synthase/HD superfamily hydrolase
MMYSFRIEQAIRAAAVLHADHIRRGRAPYPHITHAVAVSCIVADYTTDEDIIVAALLHDTIDATDYTEKELALDFGDTVARIIRDVSTAPSIRAKTNVTEQKEFFLEQLEQAGDPSRIIVAADTIHNMRSIIEEYGDDAHTYLKDFGGTPQDRLVFYQKLSNILNRSLENPIVHEFNHVFNEYRTFLDYANKQ